MKKRKKKLPQTPEEVELAIKKLTDRELKFELNLLLFDYPNLKDQLRELFIRWYEYLSAENTLNMLKTDNEKQKIILQQIDIYNGLLKNCANDVIKKSWEYKKNNLEKMLSDKTNKLYTEAEVEFESRKINLCNTYKRLSPVFSTYGISIVSLFSGLDKIVEKCVDT